MFPNGNTTDTLGGGNLFIAEPVGETAAEDALLLCGQMACYELIDVSQSFVFFRIVHWNSIATRSDGNRCMAQPLEAAVADTSQKIVLCCLRHQSHMSVKQACKDVANHILAFLLVVEDSASRPQHLGIVLHEQLLNHLSFHHVFYYNTLKTMKMLTSIQILFHDYCLYLPHHYAERQLFDFELISLTSVRLDFKVRMLLYNRFNTSDERVERLAGIWLLWPESIADFFLRQRVGGRLEEHLHQLVLHGSEFKKLALMIQEVTIRF